MTTLAIRDEASGSSWRVWPDPEVVPPGAIQEAASYLFELVATPGAASAELLIDDIPLEALRASGPDSARWRWAPGFHAGAVEAELRIPQTSPKRFEIITDPDRRKLSRDDFDGLVREILDDTFALFSLSNFRKGLAQGVGNRPPPIARLEFLRSRIEALEGVVRTIVRSPRRTLRAQEVLTPYHRARGVRGPEILKSMRGGRLLREAVTPSRLPASLRGNLPEQIRVRKRESSLDIAEHRQMGTCLRAWAAWLAGTADLLSRTREEADPAMRKSAALWARRCRALSRRVAVLAAAEPFAEAAEGPARLELTAIFRNDPAYRLFYRLWQDLNRGIASVFGDFLNLPLARTFELYELWCFLRLVRAGAEAFGPDGLEVADLFFSDVRGAVTLAAGAVTVPVGEGWKLCFQKQYREFWVEAHGRGSYSRTMTPDIVAALDDGGPGRLIVLDAKYRIDEGLNEALSSIHTYRDALVQEASGAVEGIVSAAYLLTPHKPALAGAYRQAAMPARLFHPQYRADFRFGAVTLRPGMTVGEIVGALRLIVADAVTAA